MSIIFIFVNISVSIARMKTYYKVISQPIASNQIFLNFPPFTFPFSRISHFPFCIQYFTSLPLSLHFIHNILFFLSVIQCFLYSYPVFSSFPIYSPLCRITSFSLSTIHFLIFFPTYSSIIPSPDLFFFLSTIQLSPMPFLSYPLEYLKSALINPSSTFPSTNPFRIQVIEVILFTISYFFFFLSPIP